MTKAADERRQERLKELSEKIGLLRQEIKQLQKNAKKNYIDTMKSLEEERIKKFARRYFPMMNLNAHGVRMSNMRPDSDGEQSSALKRQLEHSKRIQAEQDRAAKEKKEKTEGLGLEEEFADSGIYKETDIEIAIDETNEIISGIEAEIEGYEQSLQKQADPSGSEILKGAIDRDRKQIERAKQRLNALADLLEEAKKEP